MINRLSNPINRNRSAAKISKVMSSSSNLVRSPSITPTLSNQTFSFSRTFPYFPPLFFFSNYCPSSKYIIIVLLRFPFPYYTKYDFISKHFPLLSLLSFQDMSADVELFCHEEIETVEWEEVTYL